jgi:MFS family permease
VQLRILGNRNFGVGTLITCLYGFVLYGVTAMLPLFLQTLLGYPALDSGLAVSPRGIGAVLSTITVGRLVKYIDSRLLLACGFGIFSYSTFLLSHVNLGISMVSVAIPNLLNGIGSGSPHRYDPGQAAQGRHRERSRHLQFNAQHRGQRRNRDSHNFSSAWVSTTSELPRGALYYE